MSLQPKSYAEARPVKSDLEQFRTRWRRWLGNKTRSDKPYWTTLLNSNWLGWVDLVFSECAFDYHGIKPSSSLLEVKAVYLKAIDHATMNHLMKLDALYAENRWMGH